MILSVVKTVLNGEKAKIVRLQEKETVSTVDNVLLYARRVLTFVMASSWNVSTVQHVLMPAMK